jgi:hypothetical protein
MDQVNNEPQMFPSGNSVQGADRTPLTSISTSTEDHMPHKN